MNWLMLVLSLPTENAAARMRAWRALKACGAAVLRDGVYLLPDRPGLGDALSAVAIDVQESGGTAYRLCSQGEDERFIPLFDRSTDYAGLLAEASDLQRVLAAGQDDADSQTSKTLRRLRKQYDALVAIDYFPAEAGRQVAAVLAALEADLARRQSPGEPTVSRGEIALLSPARYRGRTWATRARPWVDRLASAWLIRRFIDPDARILWLADPLRRPAKALGFDFDGADFSHLAGRVTFEVLAASFSLERTPGLQRLGHLVHYLDVGGVQPAEADGVESVLRGLRDTLDDDDALLMAATAIFEGLLTAFGKENP